VTRTKELESALLIAPDTAVVEDLQTEVDRLTAKLEEQHNWYEKELATVRAGHTTATTTATAKALPPPPGGRERPAVPPGARPGAKDTPSTPVAARDSPVDLTLELPPTPPPKPLLAEPRTESPGADSGSERDERKFGSLRLFHRKGRTGNAGSGADEELTDGAAPSILEQKASGFRGLVSRRSSAKPTALEALAPAPLPGPRTESPPRPEPKGGSKAFVEMVKKKAQDVAWDSQLTPREKWNVEASAGLMAQHQSGVDPTCLEQGFAVEIARDSVSKTVEPETKINEIEDSTKDLAFFSDIMLKTEHETYTIICTGEFNPGPVLVTVELPKGAQRAKQALKEGRNVLGLDSSVDNVRIGAPTDVLHVAHIGVEGIEQETLELLQASLTNATDPNAVKIIVQTKNADIRTTLSGERLVKFSDRSKLVAAHVQKLLLDSFKVFPPPHPTFSLTVRLRESDSAL
jgi:hypothetical protein